MTTQNTPGAAAVLYVALAESGFAIETIADAQRILDSINAQGMRLDTTPQHGHRQDGLTKRGWTDEVDPGIQYIDDDELKHWPKTRRPDRRPDFTLGGRGVIDTPEVR